MQTGFGKMAIEEYAPGKCRLAIGGTAANSGSRARTTESRAPEARATGKGAGASQPPSLEQYDSKLEAARATYLGYLQLAKDIKRVVHHPFSIQLAPTLWYTPDFLIEWKDSRIQVEEVKGNLKQKNARDSISRLKVAAAKLPMFDWRLTLRIRGQWEERRVPTT